MFQNQIKSSRDGNCSITNKIVLEKISSKHNQVWSSFEDLAIRNIMVQLNFNFNKLFVRYNIFSIWMHANQDICTSATSFCDASAAARAQWISFSSLAEWGHMPYLKLNQPMGPLLGRTICDSVASRVLLFQYSILEFFESGRGAGPA